jgi:uncharacterized membrane protein YkoI
MKTFTAVAFVLVLTASAGVAQEKMSVSAVIAAVEAKGFTVIEVDDEGGWLEVEATNAEGRRVELQVDASTGEIIREGVDD